MKVRTRVSQIPLIVSLVVVAACGSPSSTDGSGSTVSSAVPSVGSTDQVPASSEATVGGTATTSGSAPTTSADEWDVRVTAGGGGGLIDSVGTSDLEVVGGTGPDDPWLRFGLALNYCCGEPNSVVFSPDQWPLDIGDGQLRIDGPICDGPVECTDTERRVQLAPNATTVILFEVFRNVTGSAPLSEGTLTAETSPLFDWASNAISDESMSITLRFDINHPVPPPSGDTTPTATAAQPVTVVGGGLYLVEFPLIDVADNVDELAELVSSSSEPIDVADLGIDWPSEAGLVVSIGSDLCPPILNGIQIDGGTATPVFVNAGYLMCEQPLVPYLVIAAIDRDVLGGVNEVRLAAETSYGDQDTVAAIDVSPATAEPTIEPTAVAFGEPNGTTALPPRGEVTTTVLTNGTPVYVIHHHDGTISALDPRGADQNIDGLNQIVGWVAATRNFVNRGAWDEYGRRLDGFRASDLIGYATKVIDNQVQIGSIVSAPAGSPITKTNDPPAMSDITITPGEALTVEATLELPVGTTSWINGSVHARPDVVVVCEIPAGTIQIEACPTGSPTAEGIPTTPDSANTYFGPLLATRTDDGFNHIASTSGYAGSAL